MQMACNSLLIWIIVLGIWRCLRRRESLWCLLCGYIHWKVPCKYKKNNALYLSMSVNVFSTKVVIGNTTLTSPTGDPAAILCSHPSHAKVYPVAGQRRCRHVSVIFRPWVLSGPGKRTLWPPAPALQSNTLLTELIQSIKSIVFLR